MDAGALFVRRNSPVATIVINRPERRNALTLAMWRELGAVARSLDADESVRVVVIRGAGGEAFSAGADISEFEAVRLDPEKGLAYNRAVREAMEGLAELEKSLVAVIEGYCLGGGGEIALTADIRVCDESAQFGVPVVRLGFSLDVGDVRRLVRLVGPANARELLFTARRIGADRAREIGLVNAVVPAGELEGWLEALLQDLLAGAPLAIRAAKRDVQLVLDDPSLAGVEDRDARAAELFDTQDYREAVRAFLERRSPRFLGR